MKLLFGWILIVAGFGAFLNALARASSPNQLYHTYRMMGFGIIFLGIGIFLVDSFYKMRKRNKNLP